MISPRLLVLSILVSLTWCEDPKKVPDLKFPPKFQFGVSSSAYQIEGAWNVSDKGESIWDRYSHSTYGPDENGDVACDSYRLWRRDVEMVQELGVNFYRFSISWPRLLPTGFTNHISSDGRKYYSDLIDALLEKGIEPVVTIYHWDLPQRLQDLGGWTNPLIAKWFADYARVVFSFYADRVKTWITINEPNIMCDMTYQYGFMAPGVISPKGAMLCSKHVLLAHAKAYRVYDEEFRSKNQGRVSLTNFEMWFEPVTKEDEEVAELARQNLIGIYSNPIFSKAGGWPASIEKAIANYSRSLGYPQSHLPPLSKEEVELIKGTYDFYAINYYTSRTVRRAGLNETLKPWPIGDAPQFRAKLGYDPSWEATGFVHYPKHPEGIRLQLNWLKKTYGDLPYMVIESGYGSGSGLLDEDRIRFFRDYLKQMLLALNDGVNVTAFSAWSLMDSFEWMDIYKSKFGLYQVDFSSSEKKRTPRASAFYYTHIISNRSLDIPADVYTHYIVEEISSTTSIPPYIFVIGGISLVLVVVAVFVVRQRMSKKETYTNVNTEEFMK